MSCFPLSSRRRCSVTTAIVSTLANIIEANQAADREVVLNRKVAAIRETVAKTEMWAREMLGWNIVLNMVMEAMIMAGLDPELTPMKVGVVQSFGIRLVGLRKADWNPEGQAQVWLEPGANGHLRIFGNGALHIRIEGKDESIEMSDLLIEERIPMLAESVIMYFTRPSKD